MKPISVEKAPSLQLASSRCAAFLLITVLFAGCATSDFTPPPGKSASPQSSSLYQSLNKFTLSTNKPVKPASTQPPSAPIVLREGDILNISFPGSPSLNTTQQIRRDGKIVLPLVGEITAAGTTPDNLQKTIIKSYGAQLVSKQVIVTIQSSAFPIFITGAVLHPGKILSDHPISAFEAIMEAGGFDYSKANLKSVVVIRQGKDHTTRYTLNLKRVLDGKQNKPFYLQPSDTIYVPERFTWF